MNGQRENRRARRRRGTVALEFALMFPFLLVLFLFAWDVIFYFNYEILGSYAVFAASRSYATLRDETVAKEVAIAVMAAGTTGELAADTSGAGASEVQTALSAFETGGFIGAGAFAAAGNRSEVKVTVHKLGDFPMREGYTYEDGPTTSADGGKGAGSWGEGLWSWIKGVLGRNPPNPGTHARAVQVTLRYNYPILRGFLRMPGFLTSDPSKSESVSVWIYNSCASPIEPMPVPSEEKTRTNVVRTATVEDARDLERKDQAVKFALSNFYGHIRGVRERYSVALEADASQYPWETQANPGPPPTGMIFRNQPTGMREKAFDGTGGTPLTESLSEDGRWEVRDFPDIGETLNREHRYRDTVIYRIEQEQDALNNQIGSLNSQLESLLAPPEGVAVDQGAVDRLTEQRAALQGKLDAWEPRSTAQTKERDAVTALQKTDRAMRKNVREALRAYYQEVKNRSERITSSVDSLIKEAKGER